MLLYIMNEYPSVTETFVANEAVAVNALGVPVVGYALRRGGAKRSAFPVPLLASPPTRRQLWSAGVRRWRDLVAALRRTRRDHLSPSEIARVVLAELHAAYAFSHSERVGVTHIHAHFLGRTADVSGSLAEKLGCRWTATSHTSFEVTCPTEPRLLQRRLRGVAAVACANLGVQRDVIARVEGLDVPTRLVHCGVDTQSLDFRPAQPSRCKRHIVTVGRLVTTKGILTVLEVAASLLRADGSLRWTIVGDGPLRARLTADERYRDLTPRLEFTGALEHRAILELLARASVFVLPCEEGDGGDGIPVAIVEAMALGVPVVTTSVAGIPELVIADETGFVVPPKDANALSSTLDRVLYVMPSSDLDRICAAARHHVEREFDLTAGARLLIGFLELYWDSRTTGTPGKSTIAQA